MLLQATSGVPRSAHVIVLGNEKGGSGKSTTAMHIAVALLKAGQRVATIDLDSRQKTFTHYVENRRDSAQRMGVALEVPEHYAIARSDGVRVDENEAAEFAGFAAAINEVEHTHDFVVVDTPGNDTYLMRLAHSMADTLVTPLNDSFLDFDVLGTIDADDLRGHGRQPLRADGALRPAPAPYRRWRADRLDRGAQPPRAARLAQQEDGRRMPRPPRVAARFPPDGRILRAGRVPRILPLWPDRAGQLDESTLGQKPNLSHLTARQEVRRLIDALKLPIDERGRRRAAARAEWAATQDKPLDIDDLIADEPTREPRSIAPGGQDATL